MSYTLALAKDYADESRDIPTCSVEGPAAFLLLGPSTLGKSPAVDSAAPALAEQHPKPPGGTAPKEPAVIITTMTTITSGGSSDCSLAVLSNRLGQQDE